MRRRADRTTLALALPLVLFVLFGATRVAAPVSALGLLFDEPAGFAAVAVVIALAGAGLMFVRPVEVAVARSLAAPARLPSDAERMRLESLLDGVGARAGIDTGRLILRVQDANEVNAAAGAGHLLFVTTRALGRPDEELEPILAHELGHHRGLHPVLTAVVWWLSVPGVALAAVYKLLRRAVASLGARLGALGRLLAIPLLVLLVIWQVAVMWLFYIADLLAKRTARVSEFVADRAAAGWGYGAGLATALESIAGHEAEPPGRLARLLAEHPPVGERVERLRSLSPASPVASGPR